MEAIAALVLSGIACAISAWAYLLRPAVERAQIRQLRREVAELAEDIEQMHALHHKARRRENIDVAREGKAKKSALLQEAEEILAAAKSPAAPSAQPELFFDKAAARRRMGLTH